MIKSVQTKQETLTRRSRTSGRVRAVCAETQEVMGAVIEPTLASAAVANLAVTGGPIQHKTSAQSLSRAHNSLLFTPYYRHCHRTCRPALGCCVGQSSLVVLRHRQDRVVIGRDRRRAVAADPEPREICAEGSSVASVQQHDSALVSHEAERVARKG